MNTRECHTIKIKKTNSRVSLLPSTCDEEYQVKQFFARLVDSSEIYIRKEDFSFWESRRIDVPPQLAKKIRTNLRILAMAGDKMKESFSSETTKTHYSELSHRDMSYPIVLSWDKDYQVIRAEAGVGDDSIIFCSDPSGFFVADEDGELVYDSSHRQTFQTLIRSLMNPRDFHLKRPDHGQHNAASNS